MQRRHRRELVGDAAALGRAVDVGTEQRAGVDEAEVGPHARRREREHDVDDERRGGQQDQRAPHPEVVGRPAQEHEHQEPDGGGEVHDGVVGVRQLDEAGTVHQPALHVLLHRQVQPALQCQSSRALAKAAEVWSLVSRRPAR